MFLTDIVHIQDKLPNNIQSTTVGEPLICFHKRQRWYDVVSAMLRYQSKPYSFTENDVTKNFIEEHLRSAALQNQGWFWTRSREVQHTELAHTDIRKGLEAAGF
jgi:son of sevenless-like protein